MSKPAICSSPNVAHVPPGIFPAFSAPFGGGLFIWRKAVAARWLALGRLIAQEGEYRRKTRKQFAAHPATTRSPSPNLDAQLPPSPDPAGPAPLGLPRRYPRTAQTKHPAAAAATQPRSPAHSAATASAGSARPRNSHSPDRIPGKPSLPAPLPASSNQPNDNRETPPAVHPLRQKPLSQDCSFASATSTIALPADSFPPASTAPHQFPKSPTQRDPHPAVETPQALAPGIACVRPAESSQIGRESRRVR